MTSKVFLQNFVEGCLRDSFIIELEPITFDFRLEQSVIMTSIELTGMHEHAMQAILPFPVRAFDKLSEIKFKGEFKSIVHLDFYVPHPVVIVTLELQV